MNRATTQSQAMLLGAAAAGMVVSVLLTALLGRTLSAEGFGFVALVGAVLSLAREMTDLGSSSVAAAQIAPEPARERAVLEDLLALRLGLAAIGAAACLVLAATRTRGDEQALLVLAGLAVLLQHLSAFSAVFLARQALGGPALMTVAGQAASLLASLALAAGSAAASLFAAVLVVREALLALCVSALAVRRIGYRPWPRLAAWAGSALLRRATLYGLAALCYGIAVQGAPLLIGSIFPPEELGVFAAAFRPAAPLLSLPWLVATPLAPALAVLFRADPAAFARRATIGLSFAVGAAAVIACAGQDLAAPALGLLYGGRFVEGALSAVGTLRWLAVALAAVTVLAAATAMLLAAGRMRAILALAAGCLAVDGAALAVLLPARGYVGGAMALAVATCAVAVVSFALARRVAGLRLAALLRPVAEAVLPAAALAVALWLLPAEGIARLAAGGVLSLAALAAAWRICETAHRRRPG